MKRVSFVFHRIKNSHSLSLVPCKNILISLTKTYFFIFDLSSSFIKICYLYFHSPINIGALLFSRRCIIKKSMFCLIPNRNLLFMFLLIKLSKKLSRIHNRLIRYSLHIESSYTILTHIKLL